MTDGWRCAARGAAVGRIDRGVANKQLITNNFSGCFGALTGKTPAKRGAAENISTCGKFALRMTYCALEIARGAVMATL